jgi:nitrogen PTS system EIIA component
LHLHDFLTPARVAVPLVAQTTDDVLARLVALAMPDSAQHDTLLDEVRAREAAFPTALGDGVALPHVRTAHVSSVQVAAGVLAAPLPFGASDGSPVDLFFLVLSPANAPSEHLQVLRLLSRLLSEPRTVASLRGAVNAAAFLSTIASITPR